MVSAQTRRVVITGIGVVSPVGNNVETFWENIVGGVSGVERSPILMRSDSPWKIAGEVKDFHPETWINRKDVRRMDRFAQLAVAAGHEAVKDAGLKIDASNQDNIGVFVGSGIGGLGTLFEQAKILVEKGPDRVSPFLAPMPRSLYTSYSLAPNNRPA